MRRCALTCVLLLVLTCRALAAISNPPVNTASGEQVDGLPHSSIATGGFAATTGNLIVCGLSDNYLSLDNGTTIIRAITDTAGNTYTRREQISFGPNPTTVTAWDAQNITGHASNIVTVTYTALTPPTYNELICHEYSGLKTSGAYDTTANNSGLTGADSFASGTFSTAVADEVLVAFGYASALGVTFTAGTGYTKRVNNSMLASEDQIVSSTQTNVTAAFTSTASSVTAYAIIAVTYEAAPAGAALMRHRGVRQ